MLFQLKISQAKYYLKLGEILKFKTFDLKNYSCKLYYIKLYTFKS